MLIAVSSAPASYPSCFHWIDMSERRITICDGNRLGFEHGRSALAVSVASTVVLTRALQERRLLETEPYLFANDGVIAS